MSIQLRDGLSDQSVDLVLEDLLVRFLVNVPDEDLSSIERMFFQVEEAQWFYTDFIRQLNPLLPGMKMKTFAAKFLEKCPLIWKWGDPEEAIARFGKYKSTIPVRGVALFNKDLSKVVLVQGTESNSWSFPRGKISKDESDIDCAVRETEEETGFNVRDLIDENDFVERTIRGKNYKIYLVKNVPEDYNFSPLGRNEISKIEWFDMKAIQKRCKNNPNSLFIVGTIVKPMVKWINKNKGVMNEEELMWKAEVRLKDLLGVGGRKHENPDAGRELLNILQHVNGNPTPDVAPTIHLPPHLQSLPMFNMAPNSFPFYPNMYAPNGFHNPMPENGYINPNFPNPNFPHPNFSSYPQNFQAPPPPQNHPIASPPSSSKELLSILNTKSDTKRDRERGANTQDSKNNRSKAQTLMNLFNKRQEEDGADKNASKTLLDILNKKEDPSAAQSLMNVLKKEPETSSQTLLGILNKKKDEKLTEEPKLSAKGVLPVMGLSDDPNALVDSKRPLNLPGQASNELEQSINDTNRFGTEKKRTLLKRSDRNEESQSPAQDIMNLIGQPPKHIDKPTEHQKKDLPSRELMNLIGKPSQPSPAQDIMNLIGKPPQPSPAQDIMNLIGQPPKPSASEDIMSILGQPPKASPSKDMMNLIGQPPKANPSKDLMNLLGQPPKASPDILTEKPLPSQDILNLIGKPNSKDALIKAFPPKENSTHRKSQLSTDLLSLLKKPEEKPVVPKEEELEEFENFENFDDFEHLDEQFYRKSLYHNFDIASDEEDVDHLLDEFSDTFVPTSTDLPDAAYSKPPNYYQEPVEPVEPKKNRIRLLKPGETLNQPFYEPPTNVGGQSLLALLNGKKSPGNDSMNDSYQSIYGNTSTQTGQESKHTPNSNNSVQPEFNRSAEIMKELFWKRDH